MLIKHQGTIRSKAKPQVVTANWTPRPFGKLRLALVQAFSPFVSFHEWRVRCECSVGWWPSSSPSSCPPPLATSFEHGPLTLSSLLVFPGLHDSSLAVGAQTQVGRDSLHSPSSHRLTASPFSPPKSGNQGGVSTLCLNFLRLALLSPSEDNRSTIAFLVKRGAFLCSPG